MNGLNLSPLMMRAAGLEYLADRLPLYAEAPEERALVAVMADQRHVVANLQDDLERAEEEAEEAESEKSHQERRADDAFAKLRELRDALSDADDAGTLPEALATAYRDVVAFLKDEGEA